MAAEELAGMEVDATGPPETLNWKHVGLCLCLSLFFIVVLFTLSLYLFFWALRSFLNHYIDL